MTRRSGEQGGLGKRLWFFLFGLAGLGVGVWLFRSRKKKRTR